MASRYSCDFPDRVFLKHKSKMTGDCCVFKFLRRGVDGKHLIKVKPSFSNSSSAGWTAPQVQGQRLFLCFVCTTSPFSGYLKFLGYFPARWIASELILCFSISTSWCNERADLSSSFVTIQIAFLLSISLHILLACIYLQKACWIETLWQS